MKRLFVVAALAALVSPAIAGGEACLQTGYRCQNECPLAQEANMHRSFGTEAFVASRIARGDLTATVVQNLARI